MGGSGGGGGFFDSSPKSLKDKVKESIESTESAEYDLKVSAFINDLLSNANNRNHEAINTHLDEIKTALEQDIEGTVNIAFGGSVSKHTYVDGLSDVDSLVIINKTELLNSTPGEVKEYFADRLKERFPNTQIEVGKLAVTIRFTDAEIQLLPAIAGRDHTKIPDPSGNNWAEIRPKEFANALTRVNQEKGNKVIPVIKLAKSIIASLPDKHQITGYHTESLAVEVFKNYSDTLKPKQMLKHFFQEASRQVTRPIVDRTGQSVHVDEYLGSSNSLERKIISDAFGRIARRLNNADNAQSTEEWSQLLGY